MPQIASDVEKEPKPKPRRLDSPDTSDSDSMPELVSSTESERPKENETSVTTPSDSSYPGEDNSDSAIEHMKAIWPWMDARKKAVPKRHATNKRKRKHTRRRNTKRKGNTECNILLMF